MRAWLATTVILPMLVLLPLVAPTTLAHPLDCVGSVTEVNVGSERLYVDRRAGGGDQGTWLYLEVNGEEGYQPGGSMTDLIQDPCEHPGAWDQLLLFVRDV